MKRQNAKYMSFILLIASSISTVSAAMEPVEPFCATDEGVAKKARKLNKLSSQKKLQKVYYDQNEWSTYSVSRKIMLGIFSGGSHSWLSKRKFNGNFEYEIVFEEDTALPYSNHSHFSLTLDIFIDGQPKNLKQKMIRPSVSKSNNGAGGFVSYSTLLTSTYTIENDLFKKILTLPADALIKTAMRAPSGQFAGCPRYLPVAEFQVLYESTEENTDH